MSRLFEPLTLRSTTSRNRIWVAPMAHAGRKASTRRPWEGRGVVPPEEGGWIPAGPSPVAFPGLAEPAALDDDGIAKVRADFVAAARRADAAGFDVVEGGWTPEDSVALAKEAASRGVDLVDCSSGGNAPAEIPVEPGYQVAFATTVRNGAGVPTGAVGLITEPSQAEQVVAEGSADVVLLARELLRDPHWPLRAAAELGADVTWPVQYERARPRA